MKVDIAVDERALKNVEKKLGDMKNKAPNALSKALNRAATNARKEATKETRKTYRVKAAKVKSTMKVSKAKRAQLSASVISRGGSIGLDHFKVSPSVPRHDKPPKVLKAGVKKGSLDKIPGAFVANAGNGNFVFRRIGNKSLPIERLYGPSVPSMIGNDETVDYVQKQAQDMYERTLDHEIDRILSR